MSEMQSAMQLLQGGFPTCIMRAPSGVFFMAGSIPAACYDRTSNNGRGGPKLYQTEQAAVDAAIEAGATRIQRVDCSFV